MSLDPQERETATEFHYAPCCNKTVGKRGAVHIKVIRYRRNGKTKVWKTRPGEFQIPVKHGLHDYGYITHVNHHEFHAADSCPITQEGV